MLFSSYLPLLFTQAVCTTLLEFSGRIKDEATQKVIVGELAAIMGQQCQDVAWCVGVVSPVILANPNPDRRLISALIQVMERGIVLLHVILPYYFWLSFIDRGSLLHRLIAKQIFYECRSGLLSTLWARILF